MGVPAAAPRHPRTPTEALREERAGGRDLDADLVPVKGGEPMPAEEPPPDDPKGRGPWA